MPHIRRPVAHRRVVVIVVCVLVGLLTLTAVITAVAAQNAGAKPTVRPVIASMPPEKQTIAAGRETKVADFASAHPKSLQVSATSTPSPVSVGIMDYQHLNPWNPKQPAENLWRGYISGDLVTVWAGSIVNVAGGGARESTQQGYVGVAVGTKLGAGADYHQYLTPTQHGGVKITAVNGTAISLIAEDGTAYTFNLDTRTFS